ncbi:MAG: hypothetical protein Q7T36_10965 [Fluviicoccus sp.]|uniref:hypothetical protein n=1 Tax=Fluviicoccus sp. TaxID=2003552 RepID=UPI002722DA30|nr:hypothetical protein [Fluviicoccus sp.]MDO8330977.1 hypothetical protein [Fluviicoccus sp.]
MKIRTKFVQTAIATCIALSMTGCGTMMGLPGHGGGKRSALEQRIVSTSARSTLRDLDVSALRGKKIVLMVRMISDEGGGNFQGGRASFFAVTSQGYNNSPVTTERSTFPMFTVSESGLNNNATQASGTNSGSSTVNSTGNNSSQGSATTNSSSSATGSSSSTGTNNSTGTSSASSNGTTQSTSSNTGTVANRSDTTTTTGSVVTTQRDDTTSASTGSNTNTDTSTSSTSGSNSQQTQTADSSTSSSNQTGSATSTDTRTGSSTGQENATSQGASQSQSNTDGTYSLKREVLAPAAGSRITQTQGHSVNNTLEMRYGGFGEYSVNGIAKSDATYLQGEILDYLQLNGVTVLDPAALEKMRITPDAVVYVSVDIFGTERKRFDSIMFNAETLRAETSLEMYALAANNSVVMAPRSANFIAQYREYYMLWMGPLSSQRKVYRGDGLDVTFSDVNGSKKSYPSESKKVKTLFQSMD